MSRLFAGLIVILGAGCGLAPEKPGLLEMRVPEARISSAQLRVWVHDAVLDAADRIEETADQIREGAREPVVRRNALLWKINGIQLCFRAAARLDPLGSFVDLWILCVQMDEFFDDGPGRDLFGPLQVLALTTTSAMRTQMEETFKAALKPDLADPKLHTAKEFIEAYARTHPLQNLMFRRGSLTGQDSSQAIPEVVGYGAVVAGLEHNMAAAQRVVTAYLEYLPSIARWQAELLLEDAGKVGVVADSLSMVREMAVATKELPEIVKGQTTRILSAVTEERKAAMAGIEEMRVATVKTMEAERKAITAEIDRQRLETLEEIRGERKTVLEDVRSVARDTTASALTPGKQLIDYLMGKVVLIVLAVAALFALGLGLVATFLRSKSAGPPAPPAL